jgi:hypothetical protein
MKMLLLGLFFIALQANGQIGTYLKRDFVKIRLNKNILYFFCRGTTGKAGGLTKKFNVIDTNITHVGIGFYENGKERIYNVSDIASGVNGSLIIDSFKSFISCDDVYYLSVWGYKLNQLEFTNLKKGLKDYEKTNITFDRFFNISLDDTLYCSEFCAGILNRLKIPGMSFTPNIYSLKNNVLYESYLNRKELIYYPVDFFMMNEKIKKVFELQLKVQQQF